jgi:hypothetical protein
MILTVLLVPTISLLNSTVTAANVSRAASPESRGAGFVNVRPEMLLVVAAFDLSYALLFAVNVPEI